MSWINEGGGAPCLTASSRILGIFFTLFSAAAVPLKIGLEEEKPPKLVQAFNTCSKDLMFISSSV